MAYLPHYRVTYGGILGPADGPVEQWAMTVNVATGGIQGPLSLERPAMKDAATALLGSWHSTWAPLVRSACRITDCRVSRIGENGRTQKDASGAYQHADANQVSQPGAVTGAPYPPQVTLAVSWGTALQDLCGRGRVFLPMPAIALEADLRISDAQALGLANRGRSFLNAIRAITEPAGMGVPVIASQGSAARAIPAANRIITTVSAGRTFDTMRSRRSSLDEARVSVPL